MTLTSIRYYFLCLVFTSITAIPFLKGQSPDYSSGSIVANCTGNSYSVYMFLFTSCEAELPWNLNVRIEDNEGNLLTSVGNNGYLKLSTNHKDPVTKQTPASNCTGESEERCFLYYQYAALETRLPYREEGYVLVYEDCCDTGGNDFRVENHLSGAGQTACNLQSYYAIGSPDLICNNTEVRLDHSVFNGDGDDLTFEILNSTFSDQSDLEINPTTGVISINTNDLGNHTILVAIHETKNGVIVNTSHERVAVEVFNCEGDFDISFIQTKLDVCSGQEVELNPDDPGNYEYMWGPEGDISDPDANNPTFVADTATQLTCVVTDGVTGCSRTVTIEITVVDQTPIDFSYGGSCNGSSATLVNEAGSTGDITWLLDTTVIGEGDSLVYDFGAPGTYTITMEKVNEGCSQTITKTIEISDQVQNVMDTLMTCLQGDMVELNPDYLSGFNYAWTGLGITDPTDPNPTINARDGEVYKGLAVSQSDPSCSFILEITVMTMGSANLVPSQFTFCTGAESYTIPDSARYDRVMWISPSGVTSEGSTLYLEEGFEMGMYTVQAWIGDCMIEDRIEFMGEMVSVQHTPNSPVCPGDEITVMINSVSGVLIDSIAYMEMGSAVMVAGPNIESTFRVTESTTFSGIAYFTNGCLAHFTEYVEVSEGRNYSLNLEQDTIFNGENTVISVTGSAGDETFSWEPDGYIMSGQGTSEIRVNPINSQVYTVTVTDPSGCSYTLSQMLTVIDPDCDENTVFVPNAFTPNGDGVNDEWCIYGRTIQSIEVSVFDRWGNRVYQSSNKDECWDGTYNGAELNNDVYVYHLVVTCAGGRIYDKAGNVTILK